jgi:hypothetical protein
VLADRPSVINAILLFVSMTAGLSPRYACAQGTSAPSDLVWHWYGDCDRRQQLVGRLVVDGRVVREFVFPICRRTRSQISALEKDTLTFTFRERRAHFGPTLQAEPISVDIWKAGGEPDALTLGVSFTSTQRVLLNTLHFALPDRFARSLVAPGIAVETATRGVAPVRRAPMKSHQ